MDAIEAMLTRRSIRKYTDRDVAEQDVETLLRCAMTAPTAFNQQSWRFVVVRDASIRARLSLASKWAGMLADAPVVIAVCADESAERYPGKYWTQDTTAALENILIAANALGLGAVWVGVHPWTDRIAALRETLRLPEEISPLGMVGVGHPAETKPAAERFDPGKVRIDRWA